MARDQINLKSLTSHLWIILYLDEFILRTNWVLQLEMCSLSCHCETHAGTILFLFMLAGLVLLKVPC